jgi:hypothetical protein
MGNERLTKRTLLAQVNSGNGNSRLNANQTTKAVELATQALENANQALAAVKTFDASAILGLSAKIDREIERSTTKDTEHESAIKELKENPQNPEGGTTVQYEFVDLTEDMWTTGEEA